MVVFPLDSVKSLALHEGPEIDSGETSTLFHGEVEWLPYDITVQ